MAHHIVSADEHMGSFDWELPPGLAELLEDIPEKKRAEIRKWLDAQVRGYLTVFATLAEFRATGKKAAEVETLAEEVATLQFALLKKLVNDLR